jgi:hypothetical protein
MVMLRVSPSAVRVPFSRELVTPFAQPRVSSGLKYHLSVVHFPSGIQRIMWCLCGVCVCVYGCVCVTSLSYHHGAKRHKNLVMITQVGIAAYGVVVVLAGFHLEGVWGTHSAPRGPCVTRNGVTPCLLRRASAGKLQGVYC